MLVSEEISDDLGNKISFYHRNVTSRGLVCFFVAVGPKKRPYIRTRYFPFLPLDIFLSFYFILFCLKTMSVSQFRI